MTATGPPCAGIPAAIMAGKSTPSSLAWWQPSANFLMNSMIDAASPAGNILPGVGAAGHAFEHGHAAENQLVFADQDLGGVHGSMGHRTGG